MTQPANHPPSAVTILLVMTAVTGIVDAVSFLTLGHVFTANMTGNVVFLGFALGGAPGVSIPRSLLALVCFLMGALLGGRITTQMTAHESGRGVFRVSVIETLLLLAAATIALGLSVPYEDHPGKIQGVIALTAIAMGLRNAMVRKLNVPDLTTTVLTLTLTGLAADSTLADGKNPRWKRRCAAVLAMLGGAATGALLLDRSVALPLYLCGVISAACAFAWLHVASPTSGSENQLR